MSTFLLILGLVMFVGLVVVHEWGHYIAARRGNVDVDEFGIGFPPKAMTITKKKGTEFTLNWLPLGGFVRLKGEHDADTEPGSYGAAPLATKVKIMLAGVGMNLIVAIGLFSLLALVGMPRLIPDQFTVKRDTKIVRQDLYVGYVEKNSPAQKAGLQSKDKIVQVTANGSTLSQITPDQLPKVTEKNQGKTIAVTYSRQGVLKTTDVTLRSKQEVDASKNSDQPKGYIGIVPNEYVVQRSTWSAPIVGVGLSAQLTKLTLNGLWTAVSNLSKGNTSKASEQVSGPVGIFVLLKDGSILGFQFILMIVAVISLTLAIMNILPIPALDGGRLFVTLFYRAMKKPLSPRTEEIIHGTGFAVLMILAVVVTVVDIKRL